MSPNFAPLGYAAYPANPASRSVAQETLRLPDNLEDTTPKMFRWLKDKKRSRKGREKKKSEDDYGFRKDDKNITSDYGFNERRYVPNSRTSVTDSPYHIMRKY
ncbi:hypothetical protein FSP39_013710 [Pinctada imbricata]|uniref:Uncharacterized protein n=1 Tax=Pinctada imbricata TaxID=66713 RepID=A0AA88YLN0_PINIB|nr:hypothetical protein FSP39_013710 [Pinctada imbricata]